MRARGDSLACASGWQTIAWEPILVIMFQWLSKLYWHWRLRQIQADLRARLSDRMRHVQIGPLTLECIVPSAPRTGKVILRPVDGGPEVVHEHTITSTTWDGECRFPLWDNRTLQIHLMADEDEPSAVQIEHVKALLAYRQSIKSEVLAALLRYYQDHVLPDEPTDEDDRPLPAITSVSQLNKVLVSTDPDIHLPHMDTTDTEAFELTFGARWGYQNVYVHLRNWQVESVS